MACRAAAVGLALVVGGTIGGNAPAWSQAQHHPRCTSEVAGDAGYAGSLAAAVDLVALVPATGTERWRGVIVHYADLDALTAVAYGLDPNEADLSALPHEAAAPAYARADAGPPHQLEAAREKPERLTDWYGIAPADLRRALAIGAGEEAFILGFAPGASPADTIAARLEQRGYDPRMIDDRPVWYWLEDGAFNLHGDGMLTPQRIFPLATGRVEALAVAGDGPLVANMVAAAGDTGPSLADDPLVCAVLAAVADPARPGALLQLALLESAGLMDIWPGDAPSPGTLPPYRLAAFADRSDGARDAALIALVYDDAATAEAAAPVLAERIAGFSSAAEPDSWPALRATLAPEVGHAVFAPTEANGGPAVAVVSLTTALPQSDTGSDPGAEHGAEHVNARIGGRVFTLLLRAALSNALTPLAAGQE